MYLPNLLELSLRNVRALPNDSRMGLDCRTCCSMHTSSRSALGEEGRCLGELTGEKVSRRRANSSLVIFGFVMK